MQAKRQAIMNLLSRHSRLVLPSVETARGEQIPAQCPFHKQGNEEKPSFYWNLESGLFCCLACGVAGGLYDFMMTANYTRTEAKQYLQTIAKEDGTPAAIPKSSFRRFGDVDLLRVNPVIPDWYLGTFDYTPLSLTKAGYSDELLRSYGIGYDIAQNKVTFPIRDIYGNLIGISGREDGHIIGHKGPKYRFYRKELRGIIPGYELDKSVTLWNGHRLWARYVTGYSTSNAYPVVILVEGFKAALYLISLGYENTVALMGTSLSQVQRFLLSSIGGDVLIMLDNNQPGKVGSEKIYRELRANSAVYPYLLRYPDGSTEDCQPDNLTAEQIEAVIQEGYRR